jgi:hypothetical protein
MNKYIIVTMLFAFICFVGCDKLSKSNNGSLVNATNAGVDVNTSSSTFKGIDLAGLVIRILEKYNQPIVQVDEVVGMKSYPSGRYQKVVKKYDGSELTSVLIENVYPVESKSNNLPYFIIGGIGFCWIVSNIIIKLFKK